MILCYDMSYESQVSEIADKLSPITVNKPPNKATSSEVKP